jgi:erythromycin esterase
MISLHHRIIKYLIENCGFTIVATETGLPESRLIFDYVQNQRNPEDVEAMYRMGLNKMYAEWQEGRDLIEWMRNYNQNHNVHIAQYDFCLVDLLFRFL